VAADLDGAPLALAERLAAARATTEANLMRLAQARSELRQTRQLIMEGRERRALLHESAYARLAARLESLPLIEQAKGILVAQTGCSPEHAFELLKSASQRSNVKVRDLAAEIVSRASSGPVPSRPQPR
jgi:two-component system, response regulator / RNA-binding antiterminator